MEIAGCAEETTKLADCVLPSGPAHSQHSVRAGRRARGACGTRVVAKTET